MCGIFGEISFNKNLKVNKNHFINCLNLMNHRGPDDSDIFIDNKFAFGHKRLSIIDLSKKGRQPMMSCDKSSLITFNGEIYNYKELKKLLLLKGFKFNSNTDTEVLLNGLIYEGSSFIKRCNGMFAFAYYNKNNNEFLLFRDRLGIKPFFYTIKNNKIIFSSNIKSICAYDLKNYNINLESVSAFFSFRQPLGNKTFFKNIKNLEPGNFIQIKNGKIKIKEYWSQKNLFLLNKENKGKDYYTNKIKDLLNSSVDYRLLSDVKVASLLSGGLDSSIIASIIKKKAKKNFAAYSIGYSYKDYNEFEYSKLAAKKFDLNHRIVSTNAEQYFDDMDELISLRGQPLTIPNEPSQFRLCKDIKKEATVVLSGSGADELFCGYGRIFGSVDDYNKLKNIKKMKFKEKKIFLENVQKRYGKKTFKNKLDHFLTLYSYTNNKIKNKILSNNFDHQKMRKNFYNYFLKLFEEIKSENYSDKMQYVFQKYHLKGILEREDMSSMACGVELRVPFLDHRLVEFAATIPNQFKIFDIKENIVLTSDKSSELFDVTKYILRESFKNHVPKKINERKKIGFPVPLHEWMKQRKIRERICDTLLSYNSTNSGFFNKEYIKKLLDTKNLNFDGSSKVYQNSNANKLWMCYNLEKFFSLKFNMNKNNN